LHPSGTATNPTDTRLRIREVTTFKASAETRAKMSAAKKGRPLPAEHRAAIAAALRGPAEEPWCKHCGESMGVLPVGSTKQFCNRSHAKASQWANRRETIYEPVVEANRRRAKSPGEDRSCIRCGQSLGYVRGSQLERGRGRFCSGSCRMRHQWEQAVCGLRRERSGRVVTCPGCGREKGYRRPSRIGTEYCATCHADSQEANLALLRDRARRAYEKLLAEGDTFSRREAARRVRRFRRSPHPLDSRRRAKDPRGARARNGARASV
jgi:hypothetical protein